MFPEYTAEVDQLKASDPDFLHLSEQHHALDQRIKNMEMHVEIGTHEKIEMLKKQKLLIKDRLYVILRKAMTVRA